MPQNYFQFKQFIVRQDKCAMKVCTDACLFGSLAPTVTKYDLRILDIGTGTGLLALMYAQKYQQAMIDAVEIDEQTAQQAAENFTASPWGERLKVYNTPVQEFNASSGYDIIISNPPFFENDLKSGNTKRNIALHSEALDLSSLVIAINSLLNDDGMFGVLLPYHRTKYFEELAYARGFHLSQKTLVKQTPTHNYFRGVVFFARKETTLIERDIVIHDETRQYTKEFRELLSDYYLNL